MTRQLGILMPVFSLYGRYGIGTFGKSAYEFVDVLSTWGVKTWQVLPICPIGAGGSPYSSPCSDAIDYIYIDPEILEQKGLITSDELEEAVCGSQRRVSYGEVKDSRIKLLKKAFLRYEEEVSGHFDYALFMALNGRFGLDEMPDYNTAIKEFYPANRREVEFWQFVQSEAFSQWSELKKYANGKGVSIMGDMPFYVAADGVEAFKNKSLFMTDGVNLGLVAGVPPDYFSEKGQLWGNPVYDWSNPEVAVWWNGRIKSALELFDSVRLDHFRAFDEFYAIPFGKTDALVGEWKKGPGFEFFKDKLNLPLIAEDLGIITDSVRELLANTGYPGMRVIEFGFDGNADNPHLPHNVCKNCVCYTGTHDNMPLKEFVTKLSGGEYDNFIKTLGMESGRQLSGDVDELIDVMLELGAGSDAELFIVPLADLLHAGGAYRINTPSTVSEQNWSIRITRAEIKSVTPLVIKLKKTYNR